MHLALIALALQLNATGPSAAGAATLEAPQADDSARDARRARDAQMSFERTRRYLLPIGYGGGGRCDVHLGRFCWWDDEEQPKLPPERDEIVQRRGELIASLDSLGALYPGDDWIAGMRVHYRVDAHRPASADSAALACRGTSWWCFALRGYSAHVLGDAARADSAFADASAAMSSADRCAWQDIGPLLPGGLRGRYERLGCEQRAPIEARFWMLSRPRLTAPANEWRSEYWSRRVQAWLASRASTPQGMSWGKDAEELLLRYGWPVAWSRIEPRSAMLLEQPSIVGHDPSPSFQFSPRESLLDSLPPAGDEAWELHSRQSTSRFAPHAVRRVVLTAAQLARFRRGDSTLLVAAWAAHDDSLGSPRAALGASLADGRSFSTAADSAVSGRSRLMIAGAPVLAGVEILDTTSATLARSRVAYDALPVAPNARLSLSDLLLYRSAEEPASSLDSALARAIPGDTASRSRALGLFWETYGLSGGESVDLSVTVERVDRGWLRSARQRMGLADADTPLRMKWSDARAAAGVDGAPHSISLDLGNLPEGRYRVTLSLAAADGVLVHTGREVQLLP